tara:strand:+ start:12556 stop:13137 length:582 start_codon:yes stop_codon:yes gene_type:complete
MLAYGWGILVTLAVMALALLMMAFSSKYGPAFVRAILLLACILTVQAVFYHFEGLGQGLSNVLGVASAGIMFVALRRARPAVRLRLESERNGNYKYTILSTKNVTLGRVVASLWPDQRMLYLTQIELENDHRKKGYGTATLEALTQLHHRSIVPVQETGSSYGFWMKMRSRSGDNFKVEEQISTTDWSILIRN